jgi:hypothetical protein
MKQTSFENQIPSILINFRISPSLKSDFQEVCRSHHINMTARLNLMIQEFLKEQISQSDIPQTKPKKFPVQDREDDWRDHLHD